MAFGRRQAIRRNAFRDGHPGGAKKLLGAIFSHGERRGEHAGMRIGNPQHFQNALHDAVLAKTPVQRVEGDVGAEVGERFGDVSVDIDTGDFVAFGFERCRAGLARAQRHVALHRKAAHQHGDVFGHANNPFGRVTGVCQSYQNVSRETFWYDWGFGRTCGVIQSRDLPQA
jgi:hypothetical protein